MHEELGKRRVLGIRSKALRRDGAMAVRMRGVRCLDAITVNDQSGWTRIRVFPMHQQVRHDLSEDLVPEADSLDAIEEKRIRQMLCHKIHQQVIGFDQVAPDVQAVVVAVEVLPTNQGIYRKSPS